MIVGKLIERAAQSMCVTLTTSGHLRHDYSPANFREAAHAYVAEHGSLIASARYQSPGNIFWDDEKYRGEAYPAYAWAVYVAEVAVDTTTYTATCTDFYALQEVGKVLHHPRQGPDRRRSGTRHRLRALRKMRLRQNGHMRQQPDDQLHDAHQRRPPAPPRPLRRDPSPHGPFGAKGIGELPMDGPAPAILNAIEHATGIAFTEIPLLPEDIFERMTSTTDSGTEA